jgi:hypothetical protein
VHTIEIIRAPHIDYISHSRSLRKYFWSPKKKKQKETKIEKRRRKELELEKEKKKETPPSLGWAEFRPNPPTRPRFPSSLPGPGGPTPRVAPSR